MFHSDSEGRLGHPNSTSKEGKAHYGIYSFIQDYTAPSMKPWESKLGLWDPDVNFPITLFMHGVNSLRIKLSCVVLTQKVEKHRPQQTWH